MVSAIREWVGERLGITDDERARDAAFRAIYLGDTFGDAPLPLVEDRDDRFDAAFRAVLHDVWERLELKGAPALTKLSGPVWDDANKTALTVHRVRADCGAEWHFAKIWVPWPDEVTMEMGLDRDVDRVRVAVVSVLGGGKGRCSV